MEYLIIILTLPFLGTAFGASSVLFVGDKAAFKLQNTLLGFASGVMVAASVWSLLIPAIDEAAKSATVAAWLPAAIGFMAGIGFMLLLDAATPHLHLDSDTPEGPRSSLGRSTMLVLAVTLHNIPEGALISLPLRTSGNSRKKSFLYGTLSGAVEPLAAGITILLIEQLLAVFPYLLAFAAGAMIYVVVEELIPEAHNGKHSNMSTIGFAIGFVAMMILDVALGS